MGIGILLLGFTSTGSQAVSAGDIRTVAAAATPNATGCHIDATRGQAWAPVYPNR